MKMKKQIQIVLTLCVMALTSVSVAAQSSGGSFTIEQSVIASGGGTSSDTTNNIFSVTATSGQPIAGTQSSGGQFTVQGGFWQQAAAGPTAAPANINGRITTSDGQPLAGVVVTLNGTRFARTITDGNGFYSFIDVDTDGFYVITPLRANYLFAPASLAFTLLGNKSDAVFTAVPISANANPLDTDMFFVRQQYLDFLSREPEQGGLQYWSSQLSRCNDDAECLRRTRAAVSAAFFIEQEFQETGSFIYRLYKASYGRQPAYAEFTADRANVIGGADLQQRQQSFADSWTRRAAFLFAYPLQMSNAEFVDKLYGTAQVIIDASARQAQIEAMAQGKTRAQVLSEIIETAAFRQREYNSSFVLMQYFSYLRRDPDEAGYQFWLSVLNNREPNNYRGMVCSFITSREYQLRFSAVTPHNNRECAQ